MNSSTQILEHPKPDSNDATPHRGTNPQRNVRPFYPPPSSDLDTPWTINVYSATHDLERWDYYNQVANRSYADRDLKSVGEERGIDVEKYPTYYAEATVNGVVDPVGGVRIHRPTSVGELPLHEELIGFIDIRIFRAYTDGLLSDGVTHGGGLWVDPNCRLTGLAADLAWACFAMYFATRCKWYMGAGHQYVQDAWASLGWYAEPLFGLFPYPDNRYDSYVLNGTQETWPSDLVEWASAQVGEASLDGPGVRFTVQPMRLEQKELG